MWKNICENENIDFYNYVINIHNFDLKPICDLHPHSFYSTNLRSLTNVVWHQLEIFYKTQLNGVNTHSEVPSYRVLSSMIQNTQHPHNNNNSNMLLCQLAIHKILRSPIIPLIIDLFSWIHTYYF